MNGLMFKDGGPIVSVQLEMNLKSPVCLGLCGCGRRGTHARPQAPGIEAGLIAPIYVCTAWGSPVPAGEFLPGQGGYAWIAPGEPTPYYLFNDMHNAKQARYDATQYPVATSRPGPDFFAMVNIAHHSAGKLGGHRHDDDGPRRQCTGLLHVSKRNAIRRQTWFDGYFSFLELRLPRAAARVWAGECYL